MAKVGIVTDSTTGLPADIVTEYGIQVVSMGFILNKKVYRDYLDIETDDFWKIFPTLEEIPTTSAGSLGDFTDAFISLSHSTKHIVCITISDKLSATYKTAYQAAQLVMEENPGLDIKTIDSQTSSGALALIVLEAARAAREGKNQTEVIEAVQNMMVKAKYFIILESLKYIMKVGRAPEGNGQKATPQISPIMGIVKPNTGVMETLGRAATIDEALASGVSMVGNYTDASKPIHFFLHYPDRIEKCEEMKKALSSQYKCAEIIIGQWPPTVIVATGPMYGLAFYS